MITEMFIRQLRKPEKATNADEAIDVKTNLELRALSYGDYPRLAKGDNVNM